MAKNDLIFQKIISNERFADSITLSHPNILIWMLESVRYNQR